MKQQEYQQTPKKQHRKRRRLRAGFRKKAVKTMAQLGDLFDGIRRAFDALAPTLVVVAIGSSVSTAREKFALHFAYTPEDDAGQGGVNGGPLTEPLAPVVLQQRPEQRLLSALKRPSC